MSDDEVDPRPPRDDLAFNDPAGWGYCERCAYLVAVTKGDRIRIEHRRIRNGHEDAICSGSGHAPTQEAPPDAFPMHVVSLRKEPARARSRSHWQFRRFTARENAREELADREERAARHNQHAQVTLEALAAMGGEGGYDDDGYDHD